MELPPIIEEAKQKIYAAPIWSTGFIFLILFLAWFFGGFYGALNNYYIIIDKLLFKGIASFNLVDCFLIILPFLFIFIPFYIVFKPQQIRKILKGYRNFHKEIYEKGLSISLRDDVMLSFPQITNGLSQYIQEGAKEYLIEFKRKEKEDWEILLKSLLSTFIESTSSEMGERIFILPSTFNKYAKCVQSLINTIYENKSFYHDVIIWTQLNVDITRWYNMGSLQIVDLKYAPDWWVDYLALHEKILNTTTSCKVKIRRLVFHDSKEKLERQKKYFILKNEDGEIQPLAKEKAIRLWNRNKAGMKLVQPLPQEKINRLENSEKIFIIAEPNRPSYAPPPNKWGNLLDHFKVTYHNNEGKDHPALMSGSFYKDILINNNDKLLCSSFNDTFIIQFLDKTEVKTGFGIALQSDVKKDVSGIKLFDGHLIKELIEEYNKLWQSASDPV